MRRSVVLVIETLSTLWMLNQRQPIAARMAWFPPDGARRAGAVGVTALRDRTAPRWYAGLCAREGSALA